MSNAVLREYPLMIKVAEKIPTSSDRATFFVIKAVTRVIMGGTSESHVGVMGSSLKKNLKMCKIVRLSISKQWKR